MLQIFLTTPQIAPGLITRII